MKTLFSNKHELPASVTVVALVAVTLLFLLSMSISIMIETGFLQSQRLAQKIQARWFLEGEIARWFASNEQGTLPPQGTILLTNTPFSGSLLWKKEKNTLKLNAVAGKGLARSEIHLEAQVFSADDITLLWIFPIEKSLHYPWEGEGIFAFPPNSTLKTNTYTWTLKGKLIIGTPSFIEANLPPSLIQNANLLWEKRPHFETIFEHAFRQAEDAWKITGEGFWPLKEIVNPIHPSKTLLGSGKISFTPPFSWSPNQRLYIRRKNSTNSWESCLYYRGPQASQIYEISSDMSVSASLSKNPYFKENPPLIQFPPEAWDILGEISLEGKEISLISSDEDVLALRFGENEYYFAESDFVYEQKHKTIHMTSGEFFRRHVINVGIANGWSQEYRIPPLRGQFIVYINKQRVWNYRRNNNAIIFDTPPPAGSEIQILKDIENPFLYKKIPDVNNFLYADKVERCVVLDLDNTYNLPNNGIIYSRLPLLVHGSASSPLCIVSESSLYLEDINPNGGSEIALVAREGIWLLQENSLPHTLKNVLIISPLDGLYSVGDTFVPAHIKGKAIFTAFTNSPSLSGFMEHFFVDNRLQIERIPLVSNLNLPLSITLLWRR